MTEAVRYSFSSHQDITMELGPKGIEMLGEPGSNVPTREQPQDDD